MVLSSEERQNRLDEFHKNYGENVLDENLRKEKTRVIATLSQYFRSRDDLGRRMISSVVIAIRRLPLPHRLIRLIRRIHRHFRLADLV